MKTGGVIVGIVFGGILILLGVGGWIIGLHRESEREVISHFQKHQLSHARSIAERIRTGIARQSVAAFSSPIEQNGSGIGTLGEDVEKSISEEYLSFGSEGEVHRVWIITGQRAVVFMSAPLGMPVRVESAGSENCGKCHAPPAFIPQMIERKTGTIAYAMGGDSKKLSAFVPVDFGGGSWRVVVSSDHDEISSFARKSLVGHLLLIALFVLLVIAGIALTGRTYRSQIKAREEARHLREKRDLENRIRESEAFHRTIVETAHDIITIIDNIGTITFANKSAETVSGYEGKELVGKNLRGFLHREDIPAVMEDILPDILQGKPRRYQVRARTKTGEVLTFSVNAVPFHKNDKIVGMASFARDVTARRRAEEALEISRRHLRYLSSRLLKAQEEERRRISRMLCDAFWQDLLVVGLKLDAIRSRIPENQRGILEECQAAIDQVHLLIEEVRQMAKDLSPTILEDLGLSAALEWLLKRFAESHGIAVTSGIRNFDHLVPRQTGIVLFRILQEALSNIGAHAAASQILVSATCESGEIHLQVEDNGIGFDTTREPQDQDASGLGLTIMDERARMLGGSLFILSRPGKGTQLNLCIPIMKKPAVV